MTDETLQQLPSYDHRAGSGPALVFLHYWGGSSRTWAPVIERLPGRETITIDFRGWSRSRDLAGPFTLRQFAEDVLAVLARAGVREFALVGHSMGGKVAQLVAAHAPTGLRGLVLVAPAPARPPSTVTAEYREVLSHAYDTEESRAFARDAVLTASALSDPVRAQIAHDSAASDAAARVQWPLHGIAEDISAQASRIRVPTLVIAGGQDTVEPVGVLEENLIAVVPGAQLVVVPQSGHLIPLEAPDDVAGHIASFLSAEADARTAR